MVNLLSGPRMEAAGWGLLYKNKVFTATDNESRFLMSARANEKGLYFVRGVPCHPSGASVAMMAQSGRFLNRDLPMPGTILNGGRLSATPEVMSEVAATNVNSRFVPFQGWTGDPRGRQRERLSVSLPSERESLLASLPISERGSTSFPSTLCYRVTLR